MARFEAHMTFELRDAAKVEEISKKYPQWKFSKIHGCPLMGLDKTYCYLTSYNINADDLLDEMEGVALQCFPVVEIRQKIERIVYDTKTGVNEL